MSGSDGLGFSGSGSSSGSDGGDGSGTTGGDYAYSDTRGTTSEHVHGTQTWTQNYDFTAGYTGGGGGWALSGSVTTTLIASGGASYYQSGGTISGERDSSTGPFDDDTGTETSVDTSRLDAGNRSSGGSEWSDYEQTTSVLASGGVTTTTTTSDSGSTHWGDAFGVSDSTNLTEAGSGSNSSFEYSSHNAFTDDGSISGSSSWSEDYTSVTNPAGSTTLTGSGSGSTSISGSATYTGSGGGAETSSTWGTGGSSYHHESWASGATQHESFSYTAGWSKEAGSRGHSWESNLGSGSGLYSNSGSWLSIIKSYGSGSGLGSGSGSSSGSGSGSSSGSGSGSSSGSGSGSDTGGSGGSGGVTARSSGGTHWTTTTSYRRTGGSAEFTGGLFTGVGVVEFGWMGDASGYPASDGPIALVGPGPFGEVNSPPDALTAAQMAASDWYDSPTLPSAAGAGSLGPWYTGPEIAVPTLGAVGASVPTPSEVSASNAGGLPDDPTAATAAAGSGLSGGPASEIPSYGLATDAGEPSAFVGATPTLAGDMSTGTGLAGDGLPSWQTTLDSLLLLPASSGSYDARTTRSVDLAGDGQTLGVAGPGVMPGDPEPSSPSQLLIPRSQKEQVAKLFAEAGVQVTFSNVDPSKATLDSAFLRVNIPDKVQNETNNSVYHNPIANAFDKHGISNENKPGGGDTDLLQVVKAFYRGSTGPRTPSSTNYTDRYIAFDPVTGKLKMSTDPVDLMPYVTVDQQIEIAANALLGKLQNSTVSVGDVGAFTLGAAEGFFVEGLGGTLKFLGEVAQFVEMFNPLSLSNSIKLGTVARNLAAKSTNGSWRPWKWSVPAAEQVQEELMNQFSDQIQKILALKNLSEEASKYIADIGLEIVKAGGVSQFLASPKGQQIAGFVGMIVTKLTTNLDSEKLGKVVGFVTYMVVEALAIDLLTGGTATPALLAKLAGTLEKVAPKLEKLGVAADKIAEVARLLRGSEKAIAATVKAFCFAEGTQLLVPGGFKAVQDFEVGDPLLSADQDDSTCKVEVRHVEAVFRRTSLTIRLVIGGHEICLTPGHPIFVPGRGWVQAGVLQRGDLVLGHDGKIVEVDRIEVDATLRTVYNLTVSEFHTFFVSGPDWGFSVWVHNDDLCEAIEALAKAAESEKGAKREAVKALLENASKESIEKALAKAGGRQGLDELLDDAGRQLLTDKLAPKNELKAVQGEIAGQVASVARQKAGFAEKGIPLIIDSNSERAGMAEALRAKGYNVRTVTEIFGKDPGDAAIKSLAETIGGKVIGNNVKDFGRPISIKMDPRATTVDTWIRIIEEGLK